MYQVNTIFSKKIDNKSQLSDYFTKIVKEQILRKILKIEMRW